MQHSLLLLKRANLEERRMVIKTCKDINKKSFSYIYKLFLLY